MARYLLRKLRLNVWTSVIVVLQLALALVLLCQALSVNGNYTMSAAQVQAIYGDTSLCRMRDRSDEATLIQNTAAEADVTRRQGELYTWLKSSELFTFMSYQEYELAFYDRLPNGNGFLFSYDGYGDAWMKGFRADEAFLEAFPVRVADGRGFVHADYIRGGTLPVILGSHYRGIYSVGDEIEVPANSFQTASTLTVVGIAEANSYVAYPNRPEGALLLDDYILYPYLLPDETTTFAEYDMLIFQSVVRPRDYDAARAAIKEKARALGLYEIELTKPVNKGKSYADMVSMNSGFVWITAAAVLAFASVTIVSALLHRYGLHKADYAKFRLCGAGNASLAAEFTLEVLVMLAVSRVLAAILSRSMGTMNARVAFAFDLAILLAVYVCTLAALRKSGIAALQNEEGHHD